MNGQGHCRYRSADGQVDFRERRREDSGMTRDIAGRSIESWEAQERSCGRGAARFKSLDCRCRETWYGNTGDATQEIGRDSEIQVWPPQYQAQ
jgi:hypothetical protein